MKNPCRQIGFVKNEDWFYQAVLSIFDRRYILQSAFIQYQPYWERNSVDTIYVDSSKLYISKFIIVSSSGEKTHTTLLIFYLIGVKFENILLLKTKLW